MGNNFLFFEEALIVAAPVLVDLEQNHHQRNYERIVHVGIHRHSERVFIEQHALQIVLPVHLQNE